MVISSYLRIEEGGFEAMSTGERPKKRTPVQQRIITACLFIGVGLLSYIIARVVSPRLNETVVINSLTTSAKATVVVTQSLQTPVINFYNEYTKNTSYSGVYNWENIVEPYKSTTFQVTNPVSSAEYSYIWYLDGWHIAEGSVINFTFAAPTGSYQQVRVDLTEAKSQKVLYSASIDVMNKYVRREIRSLVEQDRIAFLQAISIIFRVPTQAGKAIYGANYRSKDFFTRIHLYFGGTADCDHWHQGPGFVMSHFTLSNMFERSLQAVNPSVSLAYWDFTMESTFYDPTTFRDSPVFEDDWFGDAYADNVFHTTATGRWAYVKSMKNAKNFSKVISPYGMLRSPWNGDTTPYVTRSAMIYGIFNNLKPSGCSEYNKGLSYRDWMSVSITLNANTHGHLHELMGGSWGADHSITVPDSSMSNSGYANAYEFAHATEADSKILWRYGYMECPDGSEKTYEDYLASGEKRVCTCPKLSTYSSKKQATVLYEVGILSTMVFYDKTGKAISAFVSKGKPYDTLPGYSSDETTEIYAEIVGILCDVGNLGDMFQATSTNDVTFWVLHPTMERMWHLIQLNYQKGLISFDSTWDDTTSGICPGHFSYSVTPFKNLWDTNNIPYSNKELFTNLHPDNLPYVYEHFNWPHCEFLDYSMSGY